MSAVSEEDVLAVLVLVAARPVVTNCYSTAQVQEAHAFEMAVRSKDAKCTPHGVIATKRPEEFGSVEAAIADSERRYAVECAEREVLRTAEHQLRAPSVSTYDDMRGAVWSLWAARRGVR